MSTFNCHINSPYLKRCVVMALITVRKRSLGQSNIFAPVCHSVHRGMGSTWAGTPPSRYSPLAGTPPRQVHPPAGIPPRQVPPGRHTPWQVHPLASTPPRAGTPPGRYTPQQYMLGCGQQAGGTHPTGMHCCLSINSQWLHNLLPYFNF